MVRGAQEMAGGGRAGFGNDVARAAEALIHQVQK